MPEELHTVRNHKTSMLKLLVPAAKFLIPALAIVLGVLNHQKQYSLLFTVYVLFLAIERAIETFCSGNFDKNKDSVGKDWTFQVVMLTYLLMVMIMMFEFYYKGKPNHGYLIVIGVVLYVVGLGIRIWSLRTLGGSWQTLSAERQLITDRGPYKYVRHPIYLGVILEIIAVPLIPGTIIAFMFSIFIFCPLMILKAHLEEKDLLKLYGDNYNAYSKRTPSLIPFFN